MTPGDNCQIWRRFVCVMVAALAGVAAIAFMFSSEAVASEDSYNRNWCGQQFGFIGAEVVLNDQTRVDCLTETHAIEADYARKSGKPYECIGQALHYALMTGKQPGCLLIIESKNDCKYLNRVRLIAINNVPRITVYQTGTYRCEVRE